MELMAVESAHEWVFLRYMAKASKGVDMKGSRYLFYSSLTRVLYSFTIFLANKRSSWRSKQG